MVDQNPYDWRTNHRREIDPNRPNSYRWVTQQICICGNCGRTGTMHGVTYEASQDAPRPVTKLPEPIPAQPKPKKKPRLVWKRIPKSNGTIQERPVKKPDKGVDSKPVRFTGDIQTELTPPEGWLECGVFHNAGLPKKIINAIDFEHMPAGIAFDAFHEEMHKYWLKWACCPECAKAMMNRMIDDVYKEKAIAWFKRDQLIKQITQEFIEKHKTNGSPETTATNG